MLFIEISNRVQFTINEVIAPIRAPTKLERIKLNVDEKYLKDFILFKL